MRRVVVIFSKIALLFLIVVCLFPFSYGVRHKLSDDIKRIEVKKIWCDPVSGRRMSLKKDIEEDNDIKEFVSNISKTKCIVSYRTLLEWCSFYISGSYGHYEISLEGEGGWTLYHFTVSEKHLKDWNNDMIYRDFSDNKYFEMLFNE